jgi:hypothetical protein
MIEASCGDAKKERASNGKPQFLSRLVGFLVGKRKLILSHRVPFGGVEILLDRWIQ